MKTIHLMDIPSFIRTTDPNDVMLNFATGEIERALKASAIILHNFDALEPDALEALSLMFPSPIYTIGPLQLLLNQVSDSLTSIECNLWKEDAECIQWFNSKEPNSVLYVNFGMMTPHQLVELAWGLANAVFAFFSDQLINCRYACTEWGMGMEIDSNVRRDQVENLVRELIAGEEGKTMKSKAMEWKGKAQKATSPEGSSYLNLDKSENEILLSNKKTQE